MPNWKLESKTPKRNLLWSFRSQGQQGLTLLVRDLASVKCSIQYIFLSVFFWNMLFIFMVLHGAVARHRAYLLGEQRRLPDMQVPCIRLMVGTFWERLRWENDIHSLIMKTCPTILNCETMQSLNNNVYTYYIYICIYLHIILSPT